MAVRHGYGKIAGTDALVFAYDTGDTRNSYRGEPTVNYVPDTYAYSLYAYASGPVDTVVLNEKNQSTTVKRYTITNAINTARAAIFPSGLTTGVAYTFSFKWKYNGSTTASPSVGINASKGNPEGGANNNSFTSEVGNTVNIGNGWYLSTYTFIFSSVPTGKCVLTFGIITGSTAGYVGETFDIYEAQFEIKDHRTQYSNGTRSSTQGLVDLTGNSSVDLSNVSFDSNAQVDFDGTDDFISIPHANSPITNLTYELVVRIDSIPASNTFRSIWQKSANWNGETGISMQMIYGNLTFSYGETWGGTVQYPLSNLTAGNWYHIVGTVDSTAGADVRFYINGVLVDTGTSYQTPTTTSNLTIGLGNGGTLDGKIDVFKMYSRALTADEVRNNYNQYRTRFNI